MNLIHSTAILLAAYLVVFLEVSFSGVRWLGAQPDILPALMVYTCLSADILTVTLLAVWGGLWFDAFSGNPLGTTVLPLLVVGLAINLRSELILREERYAQVSLGFAAGAITPALAVLILWISGEKPVIGWGSLWQWLVLGGTGAAATPAVYALFERFNQRFNFAVLAESSFRPDREIKRGRA